MPTDRPGPLIAKGEVIAGAKLVEHLAKGELVQCWRAQRPDGSGATVHVLHARASAREKDNFLKSARRLAVLTRNRPLAGVVDIETVVPNLPAYVGKGGAAGTMEDVSVLGWGVTETVAFVRRVCRALATLHDNGIAHGCLRPANVLLDDDLNPRLADVGAIVLDDSYEGPSDTKHDYSAYAAREVRLGGKADARSDVFSVGRLLHFALHGSHPEEEDAEVAVLASLEHAPEGLVRIIRRCTTRDPAARYGSMAQLIEDFEKWRDIGQVGLKSPARDPRERLPEIDSGPRGPASNRPRESGRARDSERPNRTSDTPPSESDRTPTGRRVAAEAKEDAPPLQIRSYIAPPEEEADVLSPVQARVGAALGAVLLSGSLLIAYYGGAASDVSIAGAILGAVGVSLVVPPVGAALMSRFIAALVLGVTTWFLDPATALAERGRHARLENGTPEQRGVRLAKLKAKGVREFGGIDLQGVDFAGLDLGGLTFRGSKLSGASLVGASLNGTSFEGADLGGADFSGADAEGADVTGALRWQEAICSAETRMPARWTCEDGHPLPETTMFPESPSED